MGDSLKSFDLDKYFKNVNNSLQNNYTPNSSNNNRLLQQNIKLNKNEI